MLTLCLASFPNIVCSHENEQGRSEIWAFFHIIPVELLEKRQVSYAEHHGNKKTVPLLFPLYIFQKSKEKKFTEI